MNMKNPKIMMLNICKDEHDEKYAYENGDHNKYDEHDKNVLNT